MFVNVILEQKEFILGFYLVIIIIKLRVKGLRKVPSNLGCCIPLGWGKDLFYDYLRVANSFWVLGVWHMCYKD